MSTKIYTSFLLHSKTTVGKDFDWRNNDLTVYSISDNKTKKCKSFGLEISKNIIQNLDIVFNFDYTNLDISWYDTYQKDYVTDENQYISGQVLKYTQKNHNYAFGVNYQNNITKDILFQIKPFLVYAFIDTKDTHVLRDFYTTQSINTLGYKLTLNVKYKLTDTSTLKLHFSYENIIEDSVDMDYYNILNSKYLTLTSSYHVEKYVIGFGYSYKL